MPAAPAPPSVSSSPPPPPPTQRTPYIVPYREALLDRLAQSHNQRQIPILYPDQFDTLVESIIDEEPGLSEADIAIRVQQAVDARAGDAEIRMHDAKDILVNPNAPRQIRDLLDCVQQVTFIGHAEYLMQTLSLLCQLMMKPADSHLARLTLPLAADASSEALSFDSPSNASIVPSSQSSTSSRSPHSGRSGSGSGSYSASARVRRKKRAESNIPVRRSGRIKRRPQRG